MLSICNNIYRLSLIAAIEAHSKNLEDNDDDEGALKSEITAQEVKKILEGMLEPVIDSNISNDTSNAISNDKLNNVIELSSFFQQCSLSSIVAKKYAEVLVLSHDMDMNTLKAKSVSGQLYQLLTQIGMKEPEILHITADLSTSLSRNSSNTKISSSHNFIFGNGYEVRDVCTLADKLHKQANPTLEGIYFGVFTAVVHEHHVIVKESLRNRDILHEVEIFKELRLLNTSHKSTGCIEMYGYNLDQVPPFIVLEYFGEDLLTFLTPNIEHKLKRFIVTKMLEALDHLHSFGIMHGDMKPSNILVSENKGVTVKLCDMDSSKIISPNHNYLFPYDENTKHLKYTSSWVSPEVYKNSVECKGGEFHASLSIDIFSIGLICVMLECKDNRFSHGRVLPNVDADDYKKALTDQNYLYNNVLKVDDSNPFKHLLLNMCSINSSDRKTVSEILRELTVLDSTTRINIENKKLGNDIKKVEHDKQFLQNEVIDKIDNILETIERLEIASNTLLERNETLRNVINEVNNAMTYMNEKQQEEHSKLIEELEQVKHSFDSMPSTLRDKVASQIDSEIRSIHQKLHTLVQDVHKVPTLAIIVKKPPKGLSKWNPKNLITETYSLYFICAHTFQIVPCGPEGDGFVFTKVKDGINSFLKKVSPLITISLTLLKIAVSMYGVPLPLPDLSNLGIEASNAYLNDAISTFSTEFSDNVSTLLDDLDSSIKNNLDDSDDVIRKLQLR